MRPVRSFACEDFIQEAEGFVDARLVKKFDEYLEGSGAMSFWTFQQLLSQEQVRSSTVGRLKQRMSNLALNPSACAAKEPGEVFTPFRRAAVC